MSSAQDKEHAMEDTMNTTTSTSNSCEAGGDPVARMISATARCRTHLTTYTHDHAPGALEAALGAYREAMEAHELVWEAYGEDMSEKVFEAFCDAETLMFAIHQTAPHASPIAHLI